MTEQTLQFGKKPVRVVIIDDQAWFVAADLYATQQTHTKKRTLSCFDRDHLRLHTFETAEGPKRLTLVSALGAITIASYFARPNNRMVDAWVRKNVVALGFERPPLALCADGTMPVRPRAADFHGCEAWDDLKLRSSGIQRNLPVDGLPELDDDDTSRPPTKEEIEAHLATILIPDDVELVEVVPVKARKRRPPTRAKRK